jgi:hypothetical protein
MAKSELAPAQEKQFLGTMMDSVHMQFSLPKGKMKTFRQRINQMLRKGRAQRPATLKELQSLVGTIGSMSDCVTAVRLRLNSLFEVQNKALHAKEGRAMLSVKALQDLKWWLKNLGTWNGKSIIPPWWI